MHTSNIAEPTLAKRNQSQASLAGVLRPANTRTLQTIRSPLRYPGGKSRAVAQVLGLLPADINRLCSPFVGGASVELACVARGIEVHGYDAFMPLVNFWKILLADAPRLARLVRAHHPLSRDTFYSMQKSYAQIKNAHEKAAVFYVLNRSSFSGTTLSGGMSPGHQRFTPTAIARLEAFRARGFYVERADFKESICKHQRDFLYLDPPYANGGKLYGESGDCHEDFDHVGLAKILCKRGRWLLSYNDCEMVRDLYRDFKFLCPTWTYGMNASKVSNEVFILSDDLSTAHGA